MDYTLPTGQDFSKAHQLKLPQHSVLAVLLTLCLYQVSGAQSHWDQPSEIGNYQSILAKAKLSGLPDPPIAAKSVVEPVVKWLPRLESSWGETYQHPQHATLPPASWRTESATNQEGVPSDPTFHPDTRSGPVSQYGYGHQILCQEVGDCNKCCVDSPDCRSCRPHGIGQKLVERKAEKTANWVLGSRALFFSRTREAGIPLAANEFDTLWTNDNSYRFVPGVELSLVRRNCAGYGQEIRYWGLYPEQRTAGLTIPDFKNLLCGLDDYQIGSGATNLEDIYEDSDSLQIHRRNQIHNLEINLLRNGGTYLTPGGKTGNFELLGGFRWLYFQENFSYSASGSEMFSEQVKYDLSARNHLTGLQIGARNEIWICQTVSLISGTKFGLFNNRIRSHQFISNQFDELAQLDNDHYPEDEFDFTASPRKNDLSAIGELELGVAYQFAQRARLSMGYRVVGISGVALATGQIPHNFSYPVEVQRINSKDSLILGGAYSGIDICF